MKYLHSYLEEYGIYDFSQKPFNEIDNLIFSQLVYTDFYGIADKEIIPLHDAAVKFYAIHSKDEIDNMIGISRKSAQLLMECAKTRRFGSIGLGNYINNVSDDIDKQFCGICFYPQGNDIVVVFRGTDITATGVKESAMLSYMFPVPAQIEALYYFQEVAMRSKGDIRLCGHSKGGNLAVFAGVSCSNSLKKRIVSIYEDDAPGFPKWFFDRYDYKQIRDKIHLLTPQSSVFGRLLLHDVKPVIVQSDNSGIRQHQISSWIIKGDSIQTADEYDSFSDFVCEYVNDLIDYVGEEDLEIFFDTIEYVFLELGIDDFYALKSFEIKKAFSLVDSLSIIDDKQKERFKFILRKASTDFAKEFFSHKARGYTDRARVYFERFRQAEKKIMLHQTTSKKD